MDEVTARFDPMIAKLIATGETRAVALARLGDALRRTVFAGPENNLALLDQLVTHSDFATAPVTTHYLGAQLPSLLAAIKERRAVHEAAAATLLSHIMSGGRTVANEITPAAITQAIFGSPILATASDEVVLAAQSEHLVKSRQVKMGRGVLTGALMRPFWYAALNTGSERQGWVGLAGFVYTRRPVTAVPRLDRERGGGHIAEVVAPVPGRVIAIKVVEGAAVELGDTLFVLESMKMEFEVKAAAAGTVAHVSVRQDEQVTAGQLLAKWDR